MLAYAPVFFFFFKFFLKKFYPIFCGNFRNLPMKKKWAGESNKGVFESFKKKIAIS
jgi:hypothetical protein